MEEEKNQHEHEAEGINPVTKKMISLESYFNVRATGDYNALPVRDLNRILAIHCFKQFRTGKKVELVEAVRGMELKDFSRSTLGECIQPAPMSLTEVIEDLTQLNWQTCPVVSVRSMNSSHAGPAGLKSEKKSKKRKKTGQGSIKKSDEKSGRSGGQVSSVVSTKSIDSAQVSNMASSTCDIEASENPAGLNPEKNKLQEGPESIGQSGRSGEQAQYRDMASAKYPVTPRIPYKLVIDSGAELARNQVSSDRSVKSSSSGGDNSVGPKDSMEVVTGASCSSSVMAEPETISVYKRKRKVNTKSLFYHNSEGKLSLSKELDMFP